MDIKYPVCSGKNIIPSNKPIKNNFNLFDILNY